MRQPSNFTSWIHASPVGGVGRGVDVEQRQAEVDQLRAQVDGAKWNLDKTIVRARADGYATNVALRKGARVSNFSIAPVMAFIDTSETIVGVAIDQIEARYIAPGQAVELTIKFMPGQIYTGRVEAVLQAMATGQEQPSGLAAAPKQIQAAPLVVRVSLDAGATGLRESFRNPRVRGVGMKIISRACLPIWLLMLIAVISMVAGAMVATEYGGEWFLRSFE